jgi:hypothetical protein
MRIVPKRSTPFFPAMRLYARSSMLNTAPSSSNGPTANSTRSAAGRSTSVTVTGASINPPSVPMIWNDRPPSDSRT